MSSSSSTLFSLVLLVLVLSAPVHPATLRDYVNSAAHYVGMDSLVSSESVIAEEDVTATTVATEAPLDTSGSAPLPRCCDLPQPPCQVLVKQVPAPTPCPTPKPTPACAACPIDYALANAKSHSRMWEVAMKGKALASTLTNALAAPVVFTNEKLAAGASLLPGILGAKGQLTGHMLSVPIQFLAAKSSLAAKGAAGLVVGVPVAIGTGVAAGVSGLMEKIAEIGRQEEICLCRAQKAEKKHEKKEEQVPCPCGSQPGLLAAGSGNEEKFEIGEPVTDTPVTEAVTEVPVGNQSNSQESVMDSSASFTTTDASIIGTSDQEGKSNNSSMMGMPGRPL